MNTNRLNIEDALKLLKAGYVLSDVSTTETYVLRNDLVIINSNNKCLSINAYKFNELYKEHSFKLLETSDEETVDILKDKEYYSWRQ